MAFRDNRPHRRGSVWRLNLAIGHKINLPFLEAGGSQKSGVYRHGTDDGAVFSLRPIAKGGRGAVSLDGSGWPLAEWRVWIGVAGKRPFSCLVRVTLIVHGQTRHIMILSNASLLKSAGFADSAADFVGHSFKRRQIVGTPFEPDGHAFAGKCFHNG